MLYIVYNTNRFANTNLICLISLHIKIVSNLDAKPLSTKFGMLINFLTLMSDLGEGRSDDI